MYEIARVSKNYYYGISHDGYNYPYFESNIDKVIKIKLSKTSYGPSRKAVEKDSKLIFGRKES